METSGQLAPKLAPKRKPRDPFWDERAAALVALLVHVFNALPPGLARWTGRTLGWLAWRGSRRYRQRVLDHMTLAFRDELSPAEKERLCRAYFQHIGLSLIEFARLRQVTRENIHELVDVSALKQFDTLLARGKGLICVPPHHGNWELCGYAVALHGYPLMSVARPLDNPALDSFIRQHRENSGNVIIDKWKVLWKLKKLLDKNAIVTLSIDQNGGVGGLFVPFFGVPASTITSPAELHLATGAPIVVATLVRHPDGHRHTLRIWDVIETARTADRAADVRVTTERINLAIEQAIRAYPEQWLWVHKRWKTRPPGEVPGPDGLPPRLPDNPKCKEALPCCAHTGE